MAQVMDTQQQQATSGIGRGRGDDGGDDPRRPFNYHIGPGHYADYAIYLSDDDGNIDGNNEIDDELIDDVQNYNSAANTSDSQYYGSVDDLTQNVGKPKASRRANRKASGKANPNRSSDVSLSRHSVTKVPGPQNSAGETRPLRPNGHGLDHWPTQHEWKTRCLRCSRKRVKGHTDWRFCRRPCFICERDVHVGRPCPHASKLYRSRGSMATGNRTRAEQAILIRSEEARKHQSREQALESRAERAEDQVKTLRKRANDNSASSRPRLPEQQRKGPLRHERDQLHRREVLQRRVAGTPTPQIPPVMRTGPTQRQAWTALPPAQASTAPAPIRAPTPAAGPAFAPQF